MASARPVMIAMPLHVTDWDESVLVMVLVMVVSSWYTLAPVPDSKTTVPLSVQLSGRRGCCGPFTLALLFPASVPRGVDGLGAKDTPRGSGGGALTLLRLSVGGGVKTARPGGRARSSPQTPRGEPGI